MKQSLFALLNLNSKEKILSSPVELYDALYHTNGRAHCLIIDENSSHWGYYDISPTLLPKGCIPILDKESTYFLNFDGKELTAIDYLPTDNQDQTPQDCFEAGCWDELEEVLYLGSKTGEKIKLGVFVALAIAFCVILFFVGMATVGG